MTANDWQRFVTRLIEHVPSGCWEWAGQRTAEGYGRFYFQRRMVLAHRFSYEQLVGPISEGLHVDHLCRNRACANPLHLEAVTPRENLRRTRREACAFGHAFSPENTSLLSRGPGLPPQRRCKACARRRQQARRDAAKEAA